MNTQPRDQASTLREMVQEQPRPAFAFTPDERETLRRAGAELQRRIDDSKRRGQGDLIASRSSAWARAVPVSEKIER